MRETMVYAIQCLSRVAVGPLGKSAMGGMFGVRRKDRWSRCCGVREARGTLSSSW